MQSSKQFRSQTEHTEGGGVLGLWGTPETRVNLPAKFDDALEADMSAGGPAYSQTVDLWMWTVNPYPNQYSNVVGMVVIWGVFARTGIFTHTQWPQFPRSFLVKVMRQHDRDRELEKQTIKSGLEWARSMIRKFYTVRNKSF